MNTISERIQRNYTENFTQEQFVEQFIYLTNKSRGEHCTERLLINKYQYGGIASLLQRLDPILFNQLKNEI